MTDQIIVEISLCGSVSGCTMKGEELAGETLDAVKACCSSGDCEDDCRAFIDRYKPEFRIVRKVDGVYEDCVASAEEKQAVCREIYFDSDSDFTEEGVAELYLIWQLGANAVDS